MAITTNPHYLFTEMLSSARYAKGETCDKVILYYEWKFYIYCLIIL